MEKTYEFNSDKLITSRIGGGNAAADTALIDNTYNKGIIVQKNSNIQCTEHHDLLRQTAPIVKEQQLYGRNLKVDTLALLFALGSWIGVFATYAQLPVLVAVAPEGWNLPSYLVFIVKFGNIGPFLYGIIQKYSSRKINDAHLIYGLYSFACIMALLMAFFYDRTMMIGEQKRSMGIFILTFGFAFVGSTSAVLCMPYMGRFRDIYLVTYLVGEGLSGFIPSLIALGQGASSSEMPDDCEMLAINNLTTYKLDGLPDATGNNSNTNGAAATAATATDLLQPRFTTQTYFLIIFLLQFISLIAFILLENLRICKIEYVVSITHCGNDYNYDATIDKKKTKKKLNLYSYSMLLIILGIVCAGAFGIYPATQSFSCLPYGHVTYHLSATLSIMANPIACFIGVFLNHTSFRIITGLSVATVLLSIHVIGAAVLSPNPPFVNSIEGAILIITCWTILYGCIGYIRLSVLTIFRQQGGKSLLYTGVAQQIGSAAGAILIFCLINFIDNLFIAYDPCR